MGVEVNLGAGLLSTHTRQRLAQELREEAERPAFTSPRVLGISLGFRLCLGDEATTANVLVYPWCADRRDQGAAQHLSLVRGYLLRRHLAHVGADVDAIAVDVALPPEERVAGLAWLVWHQRHLPVAVIRDVSRRLRLRA